MAEQIVLDSPEEWRECPGFPNYSVSNHGRIRRDVARTSGKAGTILACRLSSDGYVQFGLYQNGKQTFRSVHRLVAIAFIGPPPPEKPQVNHKNGVKADNRPENLEWESPGGNTRHARDNGLLMTTGERSAVARRANKRGDAHYSRLHPERLARGEAQHAAKLTDDAVRMLRECRQRGEPLAPIARQLGVSKATAYRAAGCRSWNHVQ